MMHDDDEHVVMAQTITPCLFEIRLPIQLVRGPLKIRAESSLIGVLLSLCASRTDNSLRWTKDFQSCATVVSFPRSVCSFT